MEPGPAERQALDPASPWWGEHLARYEFALPWVAKRATLDVACGTGLGLPVLARTAASVQGLDADASAVAEATRRHANAIQGDAAQLPFADAVFGAVVSFETIEHLRERERFLGEVARVLAPDGVCVLSTPNALWTRPLNGVPKNPFHLHEYEPEELRQALAAVFETVILHGQQLSERFVVPPFWQEQQRLPKTLRNLVGINLRRVLHRLPRPVANATSQRLWGHDFFPTAADYRFEAATRDRAPVIVALCLGPRKGGRR